MNEEFEGGCTRFYKNDKIVYNVQPKTGRALIFRQPPGGEYLHDGEQVKSGNKYLFR